MKHPNVTAIRGCVLLALFSSLDLGAGPSLSRSAMSAAISSKTVYIGIRSDGAVGHGTIDDPYDGGTETHLDALIGNGKNGVPTGSLTSGHYDIYFGAGDFYSKGLMNSIYTRYFGQGQGVTKLHLSPGMPASVLAANFNGGRKFLFVTTTPGQTLAATSGVAHAAISNMTIDGNIGAQPSTSTTTVSVTCTRGRTIGTASSTTGLSGTMAVAGSGFPGGTTATFKNNVVTFSNAFTGKTGTVSVTFANNDICIEPISVVSTSLRNVTVMGGGDTWAQSAQECFWAFCGTDNTYATSGLIFDQCTAIAPAGSHGLNTYFDISGGYQNTLSVAAINPTIEGCSVLCPGGFAGADHGFTFAVTYGAVLDHCTTDGIPLPYYHDSYSDWRTTATYNTWHRVGTSTTNGTDGFDISNNSGNFLNGFFAQGNVTELEPSTSPTSAGFYIFPGGTGSKISLPPAGLLDIESNITRLVPYSDTRGAVNSGVVIGASGYANYNATAIVSNNTTDLPAPANKVVSGNGSSLTVMGVTAEGNSDDASETIFGIQDSRAIFSVPSAGWYVLWARTSTGGATAHATFTVSSQTSLVPNGNTFTLNSSTGTATVSVPSITANSQVNLKFSYPGGTPGPVTIAVTSGIGFVATSQSGTDGSTYTYTVDDGNPSDSTSVDATLPVGTSNTGVLTPISPGSSPTENHLSQVKSYAIGSNGQVLLGYFTGAAIVTEDVHSLTDQGFWEFQSYAPGTPEAGAAWAAATTGATVTGPVVLSTAQAMMSTAAVTVNAVPASAVATTSTVNQSANSPTSSAVPLGNPSQGFGTDSNKVMSLDTNGDLGISGTSNLPAIQSDAVPVALNTREVFYSGNSQIRSIPTGGVVGDFVELIGGNLSGLYTISHPSGYIMLDNGTAYTTIAQSSPSTASIQLTCIGAPNIWTVTFKSGSFIETP